MFLLNNNNLLFYGKIITFNRFKLLSVMFLEKYTEFYEKDFRFMYRFPILVLGLSINIPQIHFSAFLKL